MFFFADVVLFILVDFELFIGCFSAFVDGV
jgi:hypothetical protein